PTAALRALLAVFAAFRARAMWGGRLPWIWTTSPASMTRCRPWLTTVTAYTPPGPIARKPVCSGSALAIASGHATTRQDGPSCPSRCPARWPAELRRLPRAESRRRAHARAEGVPADPLREGPSSRSGGGAAGGGSPAGRWEPSAAEYTLMRVDLRRVAYGPLSTTVRDRQLRRL